MSDTALNALYPSANSATAGPSASAQQAAPSSEAEALASTAAQGEGAKHDPAAQPGATSTAAVDEANKLASAAAENAKRTAAIVDDRPALNLYGDNVPTKEFVKWDEVPAAKPEDIKLDVTFIDNADRSPEGDAARAKLTEAFVAAGAGQTIARELYADAARAAKPGYTPPNKEASEAELREVFGSHYETRVAGAVELVRKAADVDPTIIEFLERTGLGNDPKFIRKLANRAAAMSRAKFGRPPPKSILGAIVVAVAAVALLFPGVASAGLCH